MTNEEYNIIKSGIQQYGTNIAFLCLYDYEKREAYEKCDLLTKALKRFHEEINMPYLLIPKDEILKNYESDFWYFNLSGNTAIQNIDFYKAGFKALLNVIHGNRYQNEYKVTF